MAKRKATAKQFSLGVDYGTNSVRAVIVDISDGREIASSTFNYPSGVDGILLDDKDPNLARQNPTDYLVGFEKSVRAAVRAAAKKRGFAPNRIVCIGIDATGSTPIPVNRDGVALGATPRFQNNLDAQAWLWKDHTAHAEAAEITEKAANADADYLAKCGGTYSSEWYWSKMLHCRRVAPHVFKAAYSWVEQSDFIPAHLTGNTQPDKMARNACAAGHKAMYHEQWGGVPSREFLASLSPDLAVHRDRYSPAAVTSDHAAGHLTADIAEKAGLPARIPVAVGIIDAHAGAVGAGVRPGALVKVLGTSTCDMMVAPMRHPLNDIDGLCGIVPGSIVPGMYGLEAGQSAVGDLFNWFAGHLSPPAFAKGDTHANLTAAAAKLKPGQSGLLALDWNNGNRCILVDPLLAGLLVGQTLHTTAPEIYRALIEATAFGALTIINQFESGGVKVRQVINCGGVAEKNPLLMQIYADVCNRPMKISGSSETCALGAAIFGSVVGGAHQSVQAAQKRMTRLATREYHPNRQAAAVYRQLFTLYTQLHDCFGTTEYRGNLHAVMKQLINLRNTVRQ
ncbi:MAG: ribulokinase [Planctomycetaceae bacterium]|nr:ribulokinase [Planctomycetaceae bacterium]